MSVLKSIARKIGISAYSDLEEFKTIARENDVSELQIVYGSKHGRGCGYDVPFKTVVRIDTKNGREIPPFYATKYEGCFPNVEGEENRMAGAITNVKTMLSGFSFLSDIRDDATDL